MYVQQYAPVLGSLAWSSLVAALPLLVLFVLLGGLRVRAWLASVIALVVSLLVAVLVYAMPVGQALLAGTEGAVFGFFPILWIVINALCNASRERYTDRPCSAPARPVTSW